MRLRTALLTALTALALTPPAAASAAAAEPDASDAAVPLSGLVITEFAPSGPFGHEFVEVTNLGATTVSGASLLICTKTGYVGGAVLSNSIAPGQSVVVSTMVGTGEYNYVGDVPNDGGWELVDGNGITIDGVGLSVLTPCTEGLPAEPCDWAASMSLHRTTDINNNLVDFRCDAWSPGSHP